MSSSFDLIIKNGKCFIDGQLKKADIDTGIIFVCQRPDAEIFTPMKERDKSFSEALKHAKNFGVKIWCITLNVGLKEINYIKQIPVKFDN